MSKEGLYFDGDLAALYHHQHLWLPTCPKVLRIAIRFFLLVDLRGVWQGQGSGSIKRAVVCLPSPFDTLLTIDPKVHIVVQCWTNTAYSNSWRLAKVK